MRKTDFLGIAYENGDDDGLSALIVTRGKGDQMKLVYVVIGEKAEKLYKYLVGEVEMP